MIETGLKELDKFLDGGIKDGLITSISGQSATGKTQLVFQICLNALHSGKLAGKAIAACIADGDVSAKALDATYTKSLKSSYIFRDLKRFEPATKFLNHPGNFTWLPEMLGKTANRVFREIGEEKVPAEKVLRGVRKELRAKNKANKKGMGLFGLLKLGLLGRKL